MHIDLNLPARTTTRINLALIIWIGLGIIGGVFAFPFSYITRLNVLIGFCLLPFVLFFQDKPRINYVHLGFMLFFAVIAYAYSVRIFYFFALAFYFIFLLEYNIGKINTLVLFLFVFMSPFFEQVAVILGFPLRLLLSEWAGNLLFLGGLDIQVQGNLMLLNGAGFTVDEACMGLNLLSISMLIGVFMIAHCYRLTTLRLKLTSLIAFFIMAFLLNVLTNLLRIVILVAFAIPPEDPMHEIIGILCLVLYVIVPLYFISQWMLRTWGKSSSIQTEKKSFNPYVKALISILAVCMLWLGLHVSLQREQATAAHAGVTMKKNFQFVRMNDGITKMYDEEILVYIKPIPEFFTGEHTPLICWKGSGYLFKSVKKITISGREIYFGELVKPSARLFTAWWYGNGSIQTIDQMDWRMRMLKGEDKFCLINVTASDECTLRENLTEIFESDLLTINPQSTK